MRILTVVGGFPKLSQTFILNQIVGLLDRGHDVRIYASYRGNTSAVHAIVDPYQLLDRTSYGEPPGDLNGFDVALCQFGPKAQPFLNFPGKLVTCFRGYDLSRRIRQDRHCYDRLFQRGDLFLPVCRYFKARLIKLGCPAERIEVLHSAIDCEKFRFVPRQLPSDGLIHIVSLGRLTEKKGFDDALDAVATVRVRGYAVHYTIVGEGELKTQLRERISRLGITDHVDLVGALPHEEVVRVLERGHLFLLPCRRTHDGNEEGIPNAIKEAMAMGLPVLSTEHAGIPELVENGVSGYLVPPSDPVALAQRLQHMLEHTAEWPFLARVARTKVERDFEMNHTNARLERLLHNLVEDGGL